MWVSGWAAASPPASTASSAPADVNDVPGAILATTVKPLAASFTGWNGLYTVGYVIQFRGRRVPAAVTPTMVTVSLRTFSVLPTTSPMPPNSVCDRSSLMTATGGAPAL